MDAISNEMLKHLPENFLIFLYFIFQKCWIDRNLPQMWKQSIVVPIRRQGRSRHVCGSYRPIALTSHVGKLMERIVLNRLVHYCEKNGTIPVNQADIRQGRSTVDHPIKLTTQVKHQFARRKLSLQPFCDIEKAYRQVWHSRLLYKLTSISLWGNLFNYIKTFLGDIFIRVNVGNDYSNPGTLQMGIPQRSVISPLPLNTLLNDLPKVVSHNVEVVQDTDDTRVSGQNGVSLQ